MQDILELSKYIENTFHNYENILTTKSEILITFHKDFVITIQLEGGFYKIFFNDIFYYDVDFQDIKDTIDDFLTNKYAFCVMKNRIKFIELNDFKDDSKFSHIWTLEKTLK